MGVSGEQVNGRNLTAEERMRYSNSFPGYGVVCGGDRKYASEARERVKVFVAEHFKLRR